MFWRLPIAAHYLCRFVWIRLTGTLRGPSAPLQTPARFPQRHARIGLTQPTLSRQVAALEDALGVTLFERIGKKLALTDAGLGLLA